MKHWRLTYSAVVLAASLCRADDSMWLQPATPDGALIWGRKDGIVFGVPSPGGMRGPRGLIRVGIWNQAKNEAELINFIAIEPVVSGPGSRQSRMGFSELEKGSDGKQGKILTVSGGPASRVTISTKPLVEKMTVRIDVEPFTANRAHVYVNGSVRSDRPGELMLSVHHFEDSAPVEELTVTATMGNYERLRWLWLRNKVIDSRALFEGHTGTRFIDKENYPKDQMIRLPQGDLIVLATANETDPSKAAVPERPSWTYKSRKLTQYWKVPRSEIQPDLRVKVNGRYTYWASEIPIPGGLAFENFEVRQKYVPGQMFIFGLTDKEPQAIRPAIPDLGRPEVRE